MVDYTDFSQPRFLGIRLLVWVALLLALVLFWGWVVQSVWRAL